MQSHRLVYGGWVVLSKHACEPYVFPAKATAEGCIMLSQARQSHIGTNHHLYRMSEDNPLRIGPNVDSAAQQQGTAGAGGGGGGGGAHPTQACQRGVEHSTEAPHAKPPNFVSPTPVVLFLATQQPRRDLQRRRQQEHTATHSGSRRLAPPSLASSMTARRSQSR